MKCKKLFALLLSLCMIMSTVIVPISAEAAGLTTITVGSVEAEPGTSIVVPVSISNNQNGDPDYPGLTGLTLNIMYDASVLTYSKAVTGEALPDLDFTKPGGKYTEGNLTFNWDGTDADCTDGEILLITFNVAEDAPSGDHAIDVIVVSACDYMLDDVETVAVSGAAKIPGADTPEKPEITTITVGSVAGAKPGEEVVVPVSIAGNDNGDPDYPGLTGLTLNFKYDANVLAYKSAAAGDALPDLDLTKPGKTFTEGDITFNWDGTDADCTDGEILAITFTVKEDAAGGDHAIDVVVNSACDYNLEDVETIAVGGIVNVDAPEKPVIPEITTITVGSVAGAKPGDEIEVPVSIAGNDNGDPDYPGLTGLTLNFKYDANILAYKSAAAGDALPDLDLTKPGKTFTEGDITFNWDGTDADCTDGEILVITFTVKEEATGGDHAIDVVVNSACDYNLEDVETIAVGGVVNVDGPVHEHSYTEEVTLAPTHTTEGVKTFTCKCGDTYTETIPANADDHSYEEKITTEATCGSDGVKTFTCICGDSYTEAIPATGKHSYKSEVTLAPTHTDTGIETFTCTVCGDSYTKDIPANADDHKYESKVTVVPTHTTPGEMTYTCICGDTYTEEIPVNGDDHAYVGNVTLEPTHTTEGVKTYTCVCGASYTEVIPAKVDDHSYVGNVTLEPTHTTEGVKTFTCICGDTYEEAIPALVDAHEYDEGVVTKAADHFSTGIMTFTCICGDSYTEEIPVVPHEYSDWVKADANNHKKTCACGSVVTEKHNWDEGVVTLAPTIEAEGVMTYTCSDCKATYTESIEKLPDPNTDTTVRVGNVSAQQGEEVVVPVSISNNKDGLTGLTLQIEYDSSVLSLVDASNEDAKALKKLTFTKPGDMLANPLKFLWDGVDADDSDGVILLLTFKVADNAADDGHFVTPIIIGACDANVEDVTIAAVEGTVTVHTHTVTLVGKVDATCTTEGTLAHYLCSECGKAFEDEAATKELESLVIPAAGHAYGEWTQENDGSHIKTCSVCGDVIREAHTWARNEITTEPTCTVTGIRTYYCDICNGTKEEVVPAYGHAMTFVAKVDAVCGVAGNVAHYHCATCGKNFADENGATEIADIVIPALTHEMSAWAKYDNDTHKRVCNLGCGYTETAPHVWNAGEVTTAPTCTTTGIKTYTCMTCNGTKTEVIPSLGHSMSFVTRVEATCTTDGTIAHYHCATCGKNFADEAGATELTNLVIPMLGHNYVGAVTLEPTCTEKGVKTFTCTKCGDAYTEEIAANGHTLTFKAQIDAVCDVAGTKAHYLCTVCGKTYEDAEATVELTNLVIPALQHVWNAGVETTLATCTTTGVMTYTCTLCGKTYTSIVNALGHNMTFNDKVDATCTTEGTKAHYECSRCDKTFEDEAGRIELTNLVIPAKGHVWNKYAITTDPTCTEEGVKTFECTVCGDKSKTEAVPALGHKTTAVAKIPQTCTTDGQIAHYACTVCGEAFADKAATQPYTAAELVIPADGHSFATWTQVGGDENNHRQTCTVCGYYEEEAHVWARNAITTEPTCTVTGIRTYYCDICNGTKEEVVPAYGHAMTFNAEVPAECEVDGTVAYFHCATCGKDFADEDGATELTNLVIPAIGHNYTSAITTAPTCTATGIRTYTCQNDAAHTYTEVVDALGHSTVFVEKTAETCTTDGEIAHYACTVCGEAFADAEATQPLTAAELVIPAAGHAWNEGEITTAPTCLATGIKTYTCTVCGDQSKTEVVDALGHDLSAWTQLDGDKVNHTKTCSRCDYTETEAHVFDAGVITTEPTYTRYGVKTYTCSICSGTYTEPVEMKVASATDIKVTVGSLEARNGHKIQVPVTISQNSGLTELQVVVEYDSSVLTYTGAEQGKALKNLTLTKPSANARSIEALTFTWSGSDNDNTNGDILYINFTVADGAAVGDYPVVVDIENARKQDGTEAPVYLQNGNVSVIPYRLGDVNDDGEINVRDVVLLRRYIVGGYGVTILEDAADITKNGEIATNDLVHLRRYILGGYDDPVTGSDKYFQ